MQHRCRLSRVTVCYGHYEHLHARLALIQQINTKLTAAQDGYLCTEFSIQLFSEHAQNRHIGPCAGCGASLPARKPLRMPLAAGDLQGQRLSANSTARLSRWASPLAAGADAERDGSRVSFSSLAKPPANQTSEGHSQKHSFRRWHREPRLAALTNKPHVYQLRSAAAPRTTPRANFHARLAIIRPQNSFFSCFFTLQRHRCPVPEPPLSRYI